VCLFQRISLLNLAAGLLLFVLVGCGGDPVAVQSGNLASTSPGSPAPSASNATPAGNSALLPEPPTWSYEVVHAWPHDRGAFTQGLVFSDGELLESTGLNGSSSLRRVELLSGRVLQQVQLPYEFFAEGLAAVGPRLFQLTWQNGKCFVYDLQSFRKQREFAYSGEGWGLATDGRWLIMSDGTDVLRFRDPDSFETKRAVNVSSAGRPVNRLNELEYVKGEIFANIWRTDFVARIEPATGKVVGMINFTGILPATERDDYTDVMNGIAYDGAGDRLFVTGKHWSKLFEVRLKKD